MEHRDRDGNPTLRPDLIAGTYRRRYEEVPAETDISVLVLAGYRPKPLMMVERKIYEIHRLAARGWRRRGQIAVELDGRRAHEADWFNAMRGVPLEISDPGLPGPQNDKSQYTVSASSFEKKIVNLAAEQGGWTEIRMYEGPPPKTALACTAGPFGEVAPEIFPCRKAGRPQGAAEAFAEGFRTVMSRPPSTRSASRSRPASSLAPVSQRPLLRVAP